jgi:hypothetical protein
MTNILRFVLGVFAAWALMFPASVAYAAADAQSQQIIRESGAALGIASLRGVRIIRVDARASAVGLTGTATQWLDISSGRFAESSNTPPLVQGDGYDGNVVWNRDYSGLVWNDGSDAGRATEISTAFVLTYGLWKPNAGGASVAYGGTKAEKGISYDVLRATAPDSKLPMQLWFDRSTHLLAREVQANGPVVTTTRFSHYRRTGGLMVPHSVHTETSQGNTFDAAVTSVAMNPADGATHVARPQSTVHDFAMQGGKTSTTIPIDLIENHVYLNVMLNGKGPYRFIFDTGGSNVVDPAVAKEIGAFGKGSAQGSGVGANTESLSFATIDSLQVGDAVLQKQLFAVAPVRAGFGVSAGQPADGLIGWEVLARYVTSFNYGENQVVLTMPNAAQPVANAHVVPFVLQGTQPQIECGIDGIASQCTIDTGARDTMSFYAPYLAANPQVQPARLTANGVTGFGFGGPAFGRLGRVREVTIGDLTLNDLVGAFTSQTQGAFANPFFAANLGGNLLRRYDVTFDYYRETMALVPNANVAMRDEYERSGLFIVRNQGKYVAVDVRPGTPAADAGIVKGDAIASLDGAATSAMSLQALRNAFQKPAGTVLHVGVTAKDGTQRVVTLTLRDYV